MASVQLRPALPEQVVNLGNWLPDQQAMDLWGGPGFSYPLRPLAFLQQVYLPETQSYWLMQQQQAVAFGQLCDRFDRHHLARLLVAPSKRSQGLGKKLILALLQLGLNEQKEKDFSLFVHRHNQRALNCYQSLGFQFTTQPDIENPSLYFMTMGQTEARQLVELHHDLA
ncbi:GNAT family N-acetyltransferase [Rheinheimera sp.]|uniref:GNAT family N-acetyltransferase n=1 Tax=Rheinheimera sp. TaxID=1869214 RepID=UPI00307CF3BE